MTKQLLFVLLCLFSYQVMAQNTTVQGTVKGKDGEALPSVTVLLKGTSTGIATDGEGKYQLNVPSGGGTLVFSFLGYKTQEVAINGQTVIDVTLLEDNALLNEVVVTGYGSTIKQDVIGNIAKVSGEDIQNVPVPTFESSLQGRATGVVVSNNSGKLGQGINIRVRGSSSITANNQPLVVIDGVPVTSGNTGRAGNDPINPLADFNFNDVESIEILKDASAAAIYGARASNGVLLITTKKGIAGKTKFNLNVSNGVSSAARKREFLNAREYVELYTEAYINRDGDATTGRAAAENVFAFYNPDWQQVATGEGFNWQDQIFKQGRVTNFDISAQGGTQKTRFFVSAALTNQEGILIKNDFERISARLNLDHEVNSRLKLGINFNLARTGLTRVNNDNSFFTPMQMIAQSPLSPFRNPDGTPNITTTLYDNALAEWDNSDDQVVRFRNISNAYATYNIIPGLNFKMSFGLDLTNQREEAFFNSNSLTGLANNGFGRFRNVNIANYTWDTQFSYDKAFGEHSISAVAAYSLQKSSSITSSVSGQEFPSDQFAKLVSAGNITAGSSTGTAFSFISYIGRVSYKFKNRYLFGVTGRYDGSSRFGVNNRFGFFPSVSAGWIVSEESFLKQNPVISFLKLRASYGLTGNGEIGNFASRGLYAGINYAGVPGTSPSSLSFDDLKWETTAQFNLGLDIAFLKDRFSLELDYYNKQTNDLLLSVNIPSTSGFTSITQNLGELQNEGIEIALNTQNFVGEFKWSTNFNIARNWNKVTALPDERISVGGFAPNFIIEGQPIGVFYTKRYAGVDPANGDALYYLREGSNETTNDYNAAEEMVVGDPNPAWTGGITNNFSYKGFDLSIFFQFVQDVDVYWASGEFASSTANFLDNQTVDQLRRWQNPGDITDVPQVRRSGRNGSQESSRFISDASYIRLKTLSFGYTLPKSITDRIRFSRVRLYFTAQNLLTFTDYDGDPEINTLSSGANGNAALGVDWYTTPQAKTFVFGVNLSF
ncbi:MAG TPA: SusC/RagA family TonB-linked outer membrane protein [Microscillaceae bacterium]|nr:SusC/RagA family TonB-linked outer membrane protein [Microscillaceae bacterium]